MNATLKFLHYLLRHASSEVEQVAFKAWQDHVDIITFYNEIFIPAVKTLLGEPALVVKAQKTNQVSDASNSNEASSTLPIALGWRLGCPVPCADFHAAGGLCNVPHREAKAKDIHLGIAKAKEKANKVDKEGVNALKDEFKSYVQEAVKVQFQDFQLAIQGTFQSMMADSNRGSLHVMTTPRREEQNEEVNDHVDLRLLAKNLVPPVPVPSPTAAPVAVQFNLERRVVCSRLLKPDAVRMGNAELYVMV
ncbi:hypothetical protein LguiB_013626 [Lonicera macranthoides]